MLRIDDKQLTLRGGEGFLDITMITASLNSFCQSLDLYYSQLITSDNFKKQEVFVLNRLHDVIKHGGKKRHPCLLKGVFTSLEDYFSIRENFLGLSIVDHFAWGC